MEICVICKNSASENDTTLTSQGSKTINNVSLQHGKELFAKIGDKVHENCRKLLVSENHQLSRLNITANHTFNFESDCIFCGEKPQVKKDTEEVIATEEFLLTINNAIKKRNNDEWAEEVFIRIESALGKNVLFHKNCRIGFRNNKQKPKNKKRVDINGNVEFVYRKGFLEVVKLIETKQRKQYSILDLIDEMNKFSNGNAYSFNQMKTNILKYFGDDIIISTANNNKTLVTLRTTCYEILNDFYESSRNNNKKQQVVQNASEIIFEDIKNIPPNKQAYPSTNVVTLKASQEFIPDSLLLLLSQIIKGYNALLRIVAIGQAIIQTAHRENVLAPLQFSLAVQMLHVSGSRFVVDTLNKLGFCSSYSEAKKFQACASIALHKERSKTSNETLEVVKYVADNVDHNLRTLDGKNTFHGMGIISIHIKDLLKKKCLEIPRIKANLQDVKEAGMVDIIPYIEKMTPTTSLCYRKFNVNEILDPNSNLDMLWKMSWSKTASRPGWAGMMQMVQDRPYSKNTAINFLPIIDMNPTDLTCISSTLHFICKDAQKYDAHPTVTFDQPLFWKARNIVENEHESSPIKRLVLCLGGFHLKMSFLGAIGHIMTGSGLDVVLGQVYGENSVTHMLSGKAYARAIRGHLLVDSALNSIIFDDILNDEDLSAQVGKLYKSVINKTQDIEGLQDHELLKHIRLKLSKRIETLKTDPTSQLWLQYMSAMDILKSNIRADRTGNFELHLTTNQNMLPFFPAAGHNLYTKSAYIYSQDMRNLKTTNSMVANFFSNGNFITRRTDSFWRGQPDDVIIEQMMMRSLKTSGGLTRGRGMDDTKRALWLLSLPARAEVNDAMQELTGLKFETSEQHKECGKTRINRDNKDISTIYDFLKERNPFAGTTPNALRNIADGVISTSKANVHQAVEVGNKILQSLEGKNVYEHSFQKCKQVVLMSSRDEISINGEIVHIDPETLFQRLLVLILKSNRTEEEREAMFSYELCHKAPSLFDSTGLMREDNSAALVKALMTKVGDVNDNNNEIEMLPNVRHVLEGDWIINKIQWQKQQSFDDICESYVSYLKPKFENAAIIFDCSSSPSTNDESWLHETKGVIGIEVQFTSDMILKMKKDVFLKNRKNKQRLIELLAKKLTENGFSVHVVFDNVVATMSSLAHQHSKMNNVIVVGQQVSLIMVLCFYAEIENSSVFYMYEETPKKALQVFNISKMREILGEVKCKHLLFAHAMGGCEKTSQLHGISKASLLTKLDNERFAKNAEVFCCPDSSEESIIASGSEIIVSLYNGKANETLTQLRYRKLDEKIKKGTTVNCKTLPPTADSTKFHCLRVFHQVMAWMQHKLNPLNFGWVERNNILRPVSSTLPPAPADILENIRCGCKTECITTRCTCFKVGLKCTAACKYCIGTCCSNREPIDIDSDEEDEAEQQFYSDF